MSVLSTSSVSLRKVFNRTASSFNPAVLGGTTNKQLQDSSADMVICINKRSVTNAMASKVLSYKPIAQYKQHTLHYVLKTIGYVPAPFLEGFVSYLQGPTSKQYLHANAHLRLILAVNAKLKTPLQLAELGGLRQRFAADAVAMQTPKVWRQYRANKLLAIKPIIKRSAAAVSWQDKLIANADEDRDTGSDQATMKVRCYQAGAKASHRSNADEIVMLFMHGGGFCIGDIDTHHEFCHAICAKTGWAVVSVDYRLAPEHPAPTALRDCIAAYAWLAEHCHTLGARPARIVLAGDSAGGCLASLLAQQIAAPTASSWQDLGLSGQSTYQLLQHLPQPMAQMPLYPVTDIETDYPSWALYGEGLLLDHADIAVFDVAYLQHSSLTREHPLISPMTSDNRQVCPTYIVAAELDVLRDQAFAYAEQLKGHGVAVETHTVLGAPHGFLHFMSVHQGLEQQTDYIIEQFARFVYQVLSMQKAQAA